MQRHTIEPRPGWQETVEAQGVIYPLTRHPDDSLRPYWDESAYYSFSLAEVEALEEVVEGLVKSLAAGPTAAYGVVKDLLLGGSGRTLHDQLELEARQISRLAASSEGRGRIEAFVRRPKRAASDGTT